MSVFLPYVPLAFDVIGGEYILGAVGAVLGGYALSGGKRQQSMPWTPPSKRRKKDIYGSSPTLYGSPQQQVIGTPQRVAVPNSHTKTQEEQENSSSKYMGDNVLAIFKDTIKVRDKPRKEPSGKPFYYSHLTSIGTTSSEGLQSVDEILAIGTLSQYTTATANPNNVQSNLAWYALNPMDYRVATTKFAAGTSNPTQEFMLEYVTVEMEVINLMNRPAWFTLDVTCCKQPCTNNTRIAWENVLNAETQAVTKSVAHAAGVAASVAANTGTGGFEYPGYKYSYAREAHSVWKPLKSYDFAFAAGQVMNIKLGIEVNAIKSRTEIAEFSTAYLKDCLDFTVTSRGTAIKSSVGGYANCPTSFGIVINYRCKFRNLKDGNNDKKVSWISYNTVAGNAVATESFMDNEVNASSVTKVA